MPPGPCGRSRRCGAGWSSARSPTTATMAPGRSSPSRMPASARPRRHAGSRRSTRRSRVGGHRTTDPSLDHGQPPGLALGHGEPGPWRHVPRRMTGSVISAETPIVFVVDDDRSVRDSLRRLIASVGMTVEVFPTARGSSVLPGGMPLVASSSTYASRGSAASTFSESLSRQTQRGPSSF